MDTINVSIPKNLKKESEKLVRRGYYASFSDLVRTSLRKTIEQSKYDLWAEEAKNEYEKGRATILQDATDVKNLIDEAKSE